MGEINEALGIGKKYMIDGAEYEVFPATLEEIEEVAEAYGKTSANIVGNFVLKDKDNRKESLFKVLEVAFGNKVPREKLKKLRRDEVSEIINFFLVD